MLKKNLWLLLLLVAPLLSAAAEPLRVGLSADYPPLDFKQDGQYHGVEVDAAVAVGKILSRPVQLVELPFEELIPALRAGRVDVLMSGLSITPERSAEVLFTDPYLQVGQMIIVHRDKIGRFLQPWSIYGEGVRVGVEPGTTGEDFALHELPDAIVRQFGNPAEAFAALRADIIDLYIHDAPTSWQLANSPGNEDLFSFYRPLTEEQLAWAVRKEDAVLALALNDALRLMRANGTLKYILDRWIPVTVEVR